MNAIEIDPQLIHYRSGLVTAGLDIGSRGAKGVLFTPDAVYAVQIPTGLYMQETADQILGKLLRAARIKRAATAYIVGTGYGRISLSYSDVPYQVVTEISCHAMGAHVLNPATRTIIDIGGQDSKAIKVDTATGKVLEFVMNDKCAAGTGRFLEKAAVTLGLTLDQLGQVSLQAKEPAQVSSQCVVFAESEVISLRARGGKDENHEVRANIAAGIHYSAARRAKNLLGRVGLDPDLVFSGGVSNNPGMWAVLEELLGARFVNPKGIDMIYAGALGAAVYAAEYAKPKVTVIGAQQAHHKVDLSVIQTAIENEQSAFIENKEGRKQAAYFCAYTPPELLAAAGVRHARLFQGGDPVRVAAGELYTQSVACDFSKSCIGAFEQGDPFHKSFDKIYNFHTCAAMKRASEVVDQFVPVQMLNLPKRRADSDSRAFYRDELDVFRKDLEELTGREIQPAAVQKQIVLHNKLRRLLKKLSDLRKRPTPILSGTDYIDLVRAYYYLPPDRALTLLEDAYRDLRQAPEPAGRVLRLMLSGSIMADGDRRLLNLIEGELGARVVVEDHCAGLRPFYRTVRESGDPLQALADGYLDQAPCARMKPLDDSIEFSRQLAEEYDVEGIVFVAHKFCACYGIPQKLFLDSFQELDIPVLALAGDYSQSDTGQLKTRVEAFIGVLEEKRSKNNEQYASA
jgi:predicted CoA-substrate-specific enzyme activase